MPNQFRLMPQIKTGGKLPNFIVKYFDPRHWGRVAAGQFRLGTTAQYRADDQEVAKQGTLSDPTEGDHIIDLNTEPSHTDFFRIPSMTFVNSVPPRIKIRLNAHQNDYVFCATIGGYDVSHHRSIVEGRPIKNGKTYPGNEKYTAYAVIDTLKFMKSLENFVSAQAAFGIATPDAPPFVMAAPIQYNDIGKTLKLHGKYPKFYDYAADFSEHYLCSAFTKPLDFEIENEIRFVVQLSRYGTAPKNAQAKFTSGKVFKESILRLGHL